MRRRTADKSLQGYATALIVSMIAGFVIFMICVSLFGVPFQFLFGNLKPLDSTKIPLEVNVIPDTPTTIGEEITVIVVDNNNRPVSDATVTVRNSNGVIISSTQTNNIGRTFGNYAGEGTIITAVKDGYVQDTVIIPHVLDKWVRDTYISAIIAFVVGIPVGIASQLVLKKLGVKT